METFLKTFAAGALALAVTTATAADKMVLSLEWVTQARFAGYHVAKDREFYDNEGLDFWINAGGSDAAPAQVIAGGGADGALDWMSSALASCEKGLAMVNIAQPFSPPA